MSGELDMDVSEISRQAGRGTLAAATELEQMLKKILHEGYGIGFLAIGFTVAVSAVVLRITDSKHVTTGVFWGILAVALALLVMSFVFFVFDLRTRESSAESLNRQNEAITNALLEQARGVEREKRELSKQPPPGMRSEPDSPSS